MTLLTIAETLAKNVGMAVPDQVVASTDRSMVELTDRANATAEELARRVDWGELTTTTTITGTGADVAHDLGQYFSRLSPGVTVRASGATVRPLTRAEWNTLTPTEGAPRYFLLEGKNIRFWPYLATGSTATASAQSSAWCSNGTDKWAADTDTSLIDENLLVKGLIVRWRRQKGMDYADYEAEFESAIQDHAQFNDRSRI